ncbi:MAG TPA: DEAD/DEAH box helicase [Treponemataceae bacterium]|nr:DEAD/DEAH box helicase [Treponemataceae bacterium]
MTTFSDLSVPQNICEALARKGITEPTPVQQLVIPRISAGENIVFQSETGTGKTFCYLLPAFSRCMHSPATVSPQVLIIAPTHELASQIKSEAVSLAAESGIPLKTALCIGGAPIKRQAEMLKEKPSILVGGPARIIELIRLKKLKTQGIEMLVLDESDRMLAPEMRDMVRELFSLVPQRTQYIACSATMSTYHVSLLEKMLPPLPSVEPSVEPTAETAAEPAAETAAETPAPIRSAAVRTSAKKTGEHRLKLVQLPPENVLKRNISHWAFWCEGRHKIETLRKFLVAVNPPKTLVFTAIAGQVENIAAQLAWRDIKVASLHAKMGKQERKQAIDSFRSGRVPVLVTSDLSARGLDIPDVTHVVQLDVNENEDFFIHRAGRTARAGKSGINAVFGDEKELRALARIEKRLGIVIYPKVLYGGVVRAPVESEGDTEPAAP